MKFTSAITASILAFCATASAWTEEDYSLYAREAELVDQDYDYGYDLYAREADFDYDYGVDHLHPRDAYEYGLYMGELSAREALPEANKADKLKTYVDSANKDVSLKAKEQQQRKDLKAEEAKIKKQKADLRGTLKEEKSNKAVADKASKGLIGRSYDDYAWSW